jgi:hypothetical protein
MIHIIMWDKKKRIEIQRDTLDVISKTKAKFKESVSRRFDENNIDKNIPIQNAQTIIEVMNLDVLEVTVAMQAGSGKSYTFMVNANEFNKGGGYKNGANGQEESVCRRTNLIPILDQTKYPVPELGCILIDNIFIVRNTEQHNYVWLNPPVKSNCVILAAYQSPNIDSNNKIEAKMREQMRTKIINMFYVLLANGHRRIILGAIGCGAFCNPSEDVANLFKEIIESNRFKNKFEHIVFSIIDHYSNNYEIFKKVFS